MHRASPRCGATGQDSDAPCIGKSARHAMHRASRPCGADWPEPRCTVHHRSQEASALPTPMHRASCPCEATGQSFDAPCIGKSAKHSMHRASPRRRATGQRLRCTVHHRDAGRAAIDPDAPCTHARPPDPSARRPRGPGRGRGGPRRGRRETRPSPTRRPPREQGCCVLRLLEGLRVILPSRSRGGGRRPASRRGASLSGFSHSL